MAPENEFAANPPAAQPRVRFVDRLRGSRIAPNLVVVGLTLLATGVFTATCLGVGVYYRGDIPMFGNRDEITIDELTVITAMERAQSKGNAVDIVFTGGSTCNRGINPKLFERQTGLTAYNFASNRLAGMRVWYWTCEAYLNNHPSPRAIVLCLSPVDIMCLVGEKPKTSQDVLDPDELTDRFAIAYGSYLPFFQIVWSRGARWQRYYIDRGLRTIRSGVLGLLPGYATDPRGQIVYGGTGGDYASEKKKLFEAGGFRKLRERAISTGPDGVILRDGEPQGPLPLAQTVIPLTDDCVRAYVTLAEKHRTKLFLCVSPISREAKFDTTGLVNWMHQLQKENPHVELVFPDVLLYDPGLFFDVHHVNFRGSDKFTSDVSERVLKLLQSR